MGNLYYEPSFETKRVAIRGSLTISGVLQAGGALILPILALGIWAYMGDKKQLGKYKQNGRIREASCRACLLGKVR